MHEKLLQTSHAFTLCSIYLVTKQRDITQFLSNWSNKRFGGFAYSIPKEKRSILNGLN
jgi:hypothetical protein